MMGPSLVSYLSFAAVFLQLSPTALADDDECQPSQWDGARAARGLSVKPIEVGQINCRYETTTGPKVDPHSCASIADKYGITVDQLVDLNPDLDKDCKSIQPETTYCVTGFHEPLRARDGLCGPNHDNATCIGTDKQCCNSKTWMCGDTEDDCKPNNCYEGACLPE